MLRLRNLLLPALLLAAAGCAPEYVVYEPDIVWNIDEATRLPQARHAIPPGSRAVGLLIASTGEVRQKKLGLSIPSVAVRIAIENPSPTGFVLLCNEATLEVEGVGTLTKPFAVTGDKEVKVLPVGPRSKTKLRLWFELPAGTAPEDVSRLTFRGPCRYDQQEFLLMSRFFR